MRPAILNTDQGGRFTSPSLTGLLGQAGILVSTGEPGRWMGEVPVERVWRSPKSESVLPHVFETGSELRGGLAKGSAVAMAEALIRHWPDARPTRHTGLERLAT